MCSQIKRLPFQRGFHTKINTRKGRQPCRFGIHGLDSLDPIHKSNGGYY